MLSRVRIFRTYSSIPLGVLLFFCVSPALAASNLKKCKVIGSDWTWFSDHIVGSITYHVVSDGKRKYEVGTGVSFRGKPRGKKRTGNGLTKIKAYGFGMIKVRMKDGKGNAKVCVASKEAVALTLHSEGL